jgi:hypothetical protein
MRKAGVLLSAMVLFATMGTSALAAVNDVTPSTNDANRDLGWAHVDVLEAGADSMTLEFINESIHIACFEYRVDGDETAMIDDSHFNDAITDGLYPYSCLYNDRAIETLAVAEYVEVRLVFGDEPAERFDWTRFERAATDPGPEPGPDAEPLPEPSTDPDSKDQCKQGGWEDFGFRNQGQCVRFVETGKDGR